MCIVFEVDCISMGSKSEGSEYESGCKSELTYVGIGSDVVSNNTAKSVIQDPRKSDVPDYDNFSLLHSLCCTAMIVHRLLQEILQCLRKKKELHSPMEIVARGLL